MEQSAEQTGEKVVKHISHQLMEMLVAATTWACTGNREAVQLPHKLMEITEYAAFAHERTLFELFCDPTTRRNGRYTDVGKARQALGSEVVMESAMWERWHRELNRSAAHVARRHLAVEPLVGDVDQLKNLVVELASAIVKMWMAFEERDLQPDIKAALESGRQTAFIEAATVTEWFGLPGLDWLAADPAEAWAPLGLKWWPVE